MRRLFWPAASLDEAGEIADVVPSAETRVIDRDVLTRLDRAIARLPAQLKEPLILTVFGDMSQAQAAALLGMSAKAIETRIYRARRKLASMLSLGEE